MNVEVISKATGAVNQIAGNSVDLDAPSIVRLDITRAQIAAMDREGHDLVIRLANGESVRIADFYPDAPAVPHDLVLREPDGQLWAARSASGTPRFASIKDLGELTAAASEGGSSLALPAMLLGGAAAAGGIVAVASGGGSDDGDRDESASGGGSPVSETPSGSGTPDTTPPAVPVASVRGDGGAITGRGEPGATITVRDAAGTVIGTTTVGADGTYTLTIAPARVDNEQLTVTQTDATGNVSPAVTIQAPDLTAPAAPTAAVDATGATVTGRGEPGATITVRDAAGTVIGTALVAADGNYTVTLATPQANGGALSVTQSDAAGNVSPTLDVAAPDITAPAAPTVAVDGTGTVVTGTGEPGARVTITDPAGTTLATVIVAADGSYSATLATAQVNGERLDARQTDAAGNASGSASTLAPDLTAPAQPTATIAGDGTSVSGTGEAGARITIVDAAGTVLGTTIVGADGSYTATLSPAQVNGEALTVRESDAAGNLATPLALTAPDATAPAAPVAALDATGTIVTGTGEPGAAIVVRDAAGTALGATTVDAQGNYAIVLATPQVNSQSLAVIQTDGAGNASPATPLTAPDLTAPAAPTITVAADGASVSGVGEPGATVTIRDPLGAVIATATVAADGNYTATLATPQIDGELLSVRQADAAGNLSPTATAAAPDLIADVLPAAPTATVRGDGAAVTGVAAGGATITLYDANGVAIATGTAAADGSYSVALTPARLDGETIRVTQADAAGAVSPPTTAIAPDSTAAGAPSATLDTTGQIVTGTAEAGATVTVRDAAGNALATATATTSGAYAVTLPAAQANGGTLSVTQTDGAGNVSAATGIVVPDTTAPAAPAATVASDGASVSGTGEAGATVTVRDAAGAPLGSAVVAQDGSYTVVLTSPQGDGQTVSVTQTDPTGNGSPATDAVAPDFTAPGAPTGAVVSSGTTLIGTGEPGATVTVTAADGTPLGSAVVGGNGSYAVTLTTPQANGEALTVVQTDPTGNPSPSLALIAPDATPPAAPAATLDASGSIVTGTGEIGATVTVRDAAGALLGSAIVTAQGGYSITLTTPQVDRQALAVVQTDGAGNASPPVALTAPDITAPLAPTATVAANGQSVTGTGEPDAIISIRNPVGLEIGTATVAADGSYTATLSTPQVDGEVLTVRQTDAAGNPSPLVNAPAPDLAPGVVPMPPSASIASDGTAVTGRAMGAATITVYNDAGTVIASGTAAADGTYSVALTPPRVDGETVFVTQSDAIGASPPTTAIASDLTAPAAPTAALDSTGSVVTGIGEPGATIEVRDVNGGSLGTATVNTAGSYAVTLSTPQVDGQLLAVTQSDGINVSPAIPLVAPDYTAPPAPLAAVSTDGGFVSGTGEPGTIATVRDAAGAVLGTATVDATGGFTVPLTPAQVDGESVRVTLTDATGNTSPAVTLTAPDFTAPAAPTLSVNGDGTAVTGTGEAGALVTITDAAGTVLGSAIVAAGGSFTVPLVPQQNNGGTLTAVQADADNNVSAPATATAPDLIGPVAPTATVSSDGTTVSGIGEAGARIVVTDPTGAPIGVTIVAANNSYAVTLSTPQANGETLAVTQTDGGGNVSPPVQAPAPDITAPAAPTLAVAADGTTAGGIGEANARVTVTVTGPDGFTVTVTADSDGKYSVPLAPARLNGEGVTATQADAIGNVSAAATATAPDITAPDAPTGTVAGDGASITGTGEAGATVTVRGVGGPLGSAVVDANGSFTIALSPAQINAETLTLAQADARGNPSPTTTITAPDLVLPGAPTASVTPDGTTVIGNGQPGALVTITALDGTVIGTGLVAANGTYVAPLDTPQRNGELLGATQRDGAGTSPVTPAIAPDSTAPDVPVATVTSDGVFVTGTGEPGARVTVVDGNGATLGTAMVDADRTYTVQLAQPQTGGQRLTVTQSDAAGNGSQPAEATAPTVVGPAPLTAAVLLDGTTVAGTAAAGATVTVTLGGTTLGTTTADANGSYSITLTTAQHNGETLTVTQAGTNVPAASVLALAPDTTAPAAPTLEVGGTGSSVIGTGEPGATVTIRAADLTVLGTAVVTGTGEYLVPLSTPQRNGETLTAIQADTAGNISAPATATAPDITAPPPPAALLVNPTGTTLIGTGEIGARVEVRSGGTLLGTGTVDAGGNFSITLTIPQVAGATLAVTQADRAGNVSGAATVVAPFDIQAFGNTATATIDLLPVVAAAPTAVGSTAYGALVSAGALNLQAEVLGTPSVRFTVQDGHNLAASFTYDATLTIGATSGYSVVVQRFDGTRWVAVNGTPGGSLLELGLLNGNLTAAQTLTPGDYRAFLTYQSGLGVGVGLLGSLAVSGTDIDYTDVGTIRPVAATGNVITDAGANAAVDVVSPGTQVVSVTNTVTGAVTTLAVTGATSVDGEWGTLLINPDGSYTYTPDANAAAIGRTDVFSYTLLDPSDGERESATLSITVGSGAITGAPVTVADVALAPVTYANVVEAAPTTAFSFAAVPVRGGLLPVGSHGETTGTFLLAPNTDTDVTFRAATSGGLSVAPNYTLTLTNLTTGTTQSIQNLAVLNLTGGIASASFALNDLPPGNYRYTLAADTLLATRFDTNVTLDRVSTLLDRHIVVSPAPVEGSLLANDNGHSDFLAVRVGTGTALTEVGNTPVVVNGTHGTLTVDEVGHYVYQPNQNLVYSTTDLRDTFTYELVQPNGVAVSTTLTVTIDVPGDNASAMVHYAIAPVYSIEPDVVSLDMHAGVSDGHLATAAATTVTGDADGAAIGLATYDLFEGRGELEDVLSHYLASHPGTLQPEASFVDHNAAVVPVALQIVTDPLDYLATVDDQTHHQTTINHVV